MELMNKKNFEERYFKFFKRFYPQIKLSSDTKLTAELYYEQLTRHKISYGFFDKTCTDLEDENDDLPMSFNIAAYVLDYIRIEEREKKAQFEPVIEKVRFPTFDEKIDPNKINLFDLTSKSHIVKQLLSIKNKDKKMFDILVRLGVRIKEKQKYTKPKYLCAACGDTGFIIFVQFVDYETGESKEIVYKSPMKKYEKTFSKRCRCTKGQEISNIIKMISIEELQEAIEVNAYA